MHRQRVQMRSNIQNVPESFLISLKLNSSLISGSSSSSSLARNANSEIMRIIYVHFAYASILSANLSRMTRAMAQAKEKRQNPTLVNKGTESD